MFEQNKAVVVRFFKDVCNGRQLVFAYDLFTKDAVYEGPESVKPSNATGPMGIAGVVQVYQNAFTDAHWEVLDVVAGEGDSVTVRWIGSGTHDGPLGPIPPTGKHVTVRATTHFKLRDGKITAMYDAWDALALMQQLGLVPTPGA